MARQWALGASHSISVHSNCHRENANWVCCPYLMPVHTPTTTMGHSVHINKPLSHTTPYTPFTICPVPLKPGLIREEHTSPGRQWPSKLSICPLKSVMTPNCRQVKTLPRTMSTQMSFPETVSDSLSEILQLSKPTDSSAVQVAGRSRR